jgi:signal transduction histidine kinase
MASATPVKTGTFELPMAAQAAPSPKAPAGDGRASLPESLLLRNVSWFCGLRWTVVACLAVFGALSFAPRLFADLGLRARVWWPFVTAGVLVVANLAFVAHARRRVRERDRAGTKANLWAQIVLDLVVLTAVVHYLGSLQTYAAFGYLFHIVLACIFFSRAASLLVVVLASGLFVVCVGLETAGWLAPSNFYAGNELRALIERSPGVALLNTLWAIGIWGVVWYLASHLSALVRARDSELAETNRRLVEAQRERTRHMLRTTHELKAPFAAVHANAQLLLGGHCGELPEEALEVVRRISRRCRLLATEIQQMLQLANLRTSTGETPPWVEVDLANVARWSIGHVQHVAEERGVVIEADLSAARTVGVEDHLKMMMANLLSNAVLYSHEQGHVQVHCDASGGNGPLMLIEDHGIGIPPEKLPRIFEEYYRTDEAARHNKESTGLGLAIVKHVAQSHCIGVEVASSPGEGTKFTLRFPSAPRTGAS